MLSLAAGFCAARLALQDKRKSDLLEMVYFGGLNCDEAAVVMKLSVATVNRELKMAKAWLKHELRPAWEFQFDECT